MVKFKILSTGCAIAKVLLLDEPAAGLERKERTRIDDFVHHAQSSL